jgi:hypothetical protein
VRAMLHTSAKGVLIRTAVTARFRTRLGFSVVCPVSRASWSSGDLDAWLTPFPRVMGRITRSKRAPLYVRGLVGSDGPMSVQPIATRLGLPGHDLHHFVSSATWDGLAGIIIEFLFARCCSAAIPTFRRQAVKHEFSTEDRRSAEPWPKQLFPQREHKEEAELSFLVGAPVPDHQPETDFRLSLTSSDAAAQTDAPDLAGFASRTPGDESMTEFSGTCSSKLQSQTIASVPGSSDHQMGLAVMLGQQKTAEQKWNDAKLTYVGVTDIVDGKGEQSGHFHNLHTNGDTSFGTFGAQVSTGADAAMTVEGEWRFTGGTGSLSKLKGSGIFKAKMTSLTDSEMTWSGSYEIG